MGGEVDRDNWVGFIDMQNDVETIVEREFFKLNLGQGGCSVGHSCVIALCRRITGSQGQNGCEKESVFFHDGTMLFIDKPASL